MGREGFEQRSCIFSAEKTSELVARPRRATGELRVEAADLREHNKSSLKMYPQVIHNDF